MICDKCKTVNPEENEFCEKCGDNLKEQKKKIEEGAILLSKYTIIILVIEIVVFLYIFVNNSNIWDGWSGNVGSLSFFVTMGYPVILALCIPCALSTRAMSKMRIIKKKNQFIKNVYYLSFIIILIAVCMTIFSTLYCGYWVYSHPYESCCQGLRLLCFIHSIYVLMVP